jgi:hypothetical protein
VVIKLYTKMPADIVQRIRIKFPARPRSLNRAYKPLCRRLYMIPPAAFLKHPLVKPKRVVGNYWDYSRPAATLKLRCDLVYRRTIPLILQEP